MDWWQTFGNYLSFFDDVPAMAFDMAMHGPNANYVGYDLAFGVQASSTSIDAYPSEGPFSEGV